MWGRARVWGPGGYGDRAGMEAARVWRPHGHKVILLVKSFLRTLTKQIKST